jgi:hypothetical protein
MSIVTQRFGKIKGGCPRCGSNNCASDSGYTSIPYPVILCKGEVDYSGGEWKAIIDHKTGLPKQSTSTFTWYYNDSSSQTEYETQKVDVRTIPATEYNQAAAKLARGGRLTQAQQELLANKGIPQSVINRCADLSNNSATRLPIEMAGVESDNKRRHGTFKKYDGIWFPCFNAGGLIHGAQLMANNRKASPKYEHPVSYNAAGWVASNRLHGESELCAQTYITQPSSDLYICEGIVKPIGAANIHGINTFGVPGSNFSSCPIQLQAAYNVVLAISPSAQLFFVPDAGTLHNRSVLTQVLTFLCSNSNVKVVEWGQSYQSVFQP